ncbi:MAG: BMP family ABC transporter substrate-binding protein [Firmicutes bacterium]|nr:BMP family ABC transporter substrate-binding protein [Bacillota bacterium]
MKKRKLFFLAGLLVMVVILGACGEKEPEEPILYEIAMLSNTSSVEDGSFNQTVWQGIESFVEEEPVSYKSYMTAEDSTDAFLRTIDEAIDGGAKIIIAAGSTFEGAIYEAQEEHPEISFVLFDGEPKSEESGDTAVGKNTVAVLFAEEQAGFLAGYAAVKEGYRQLGFMGGKELLPVQRFGYGFVQGAQQAAKENGTDVEVRYAYSGTFSRSAEVEEQAASWYSKGTEVIFACAGDAGKSVMKAAEQKGGNVIGVDTDQSSDSETVLCSAVKNLDESVNDILTTYYCENEFAGGQTIRLSAENAGIGLSIESNRLQNFTPRQYDEILRKLSEGKLQVKGDEIKDVRELESQHVQIKMEK